MDKIVEEIKNVNGNVVSVYYGEPNPSHSLDTTDQISKEMAKTINQAVNDDIFNAMLKTMSKQLSVPQNLLLPDILNKYPITNFAYTRVSTLNDAIEKIKINTLVNSTWSDVLITNIQNLKDKLFTGSDVFVATLGDARYQIRDLSKKKSNLPLFIQDGHTYDPWYRDISALNTTRFPIEYSNLYEGGVNANYTSYLATWVLNSTINKLPIKILLCEPVNLGYYNKKKRANHIKSIEPHSIKLEIDYHLIA